MTPSINILHIADLHARVDREREMALRFDALARDVLAGPKVHVIALTGDIAFSGKPEQYALAAKHLSALCKRLGLKQSSVLICPGNHDVDRAQIDAVVEQGLKRTLIDSQAAEDEFDHPRHALPQQAQYMTFVNTFTGIACPGTTRTSLIPVDGLTIGVASFNSAWRCADDNSREMLFLTMPQVHTLATAIEASDLRIAIVHHPLDWYHPTERDIVQRDFLRRFDLVLTGHLHTAVSEATITPSTHSLVFTVPSLFEGKVAGYSDGYNLYVIDLAQRKVAVHHRKYIRARETYDRNVEHAANGESSFDLPKSALARTASPFLVQRITATANALQVSIKESLQLAQKVDSPILVTPLVEEVRWLKDRKAYAKLKDPHAKAADQSCIVYGPPDVGTSIFLKGVCSRIIESDAGKYALYFDHGNISNAKKPEQLLRMVRNRLSDEIGEAEKVQLTVAIDHVPYTQADFIASFLSLAAEQRWHVILCVKQDIFFDTLGPALSDQGILFLRLRYWGPSRLKDFTHRYLQASGKTVDHDAAFQFVRNCLAAADIPTTPLLVAMYLRAFCELGAQLTGLGFVRLLEKIEETSLGQGASDSAYSLYNLRLFLRRLAVQCFRAGEAAAQLDGFKTSIAEYFGKRFLDVDPETFVGHLVSSGLAAVTADEIMFSSFVFFSFYLAQALEAKDIVIDEEMQHIDRAIRLGDSLAIYAGRQRDDEQLADKLLACVDQAYPVGKVIDVADLEAHIKHLLEPVPPKEDRDAIASAAVAKRIDYEEQDDEFESRQSEHRTVSRDLLKYKPPTTKIQETIRLIMSLRVLYNVIRNMEHLSGDKKTALLDRILEHHMQCNMALIDLYASAVPDEQFHSLSAYLVTLGGECFLSQNVGSTSLRQTIEALLKSTDNRFKRFLLVCLYADLRLSDYGSLFESYVAEATEPCIVEMYFAKIHELLILFEGDKLPVSLISAFNAAFDKRQLLYNKVHPIDLQRLRDAALNEAKRQHYRVQQLKNME
jgi:predicted MPP superfamily phosphohydrolase